MNSGQVTGLGPHGEIAAPPERLTLSAPETQAAVEGRFSVAVVLHTTQSDWSKQQLAGIVATLGSYSAAVTEVVNCDFNAGSQIETLTRLIDDAPDAIISIPIGNTTVADAHRQVSKAGIKLLLMDNAPTGLLPGSDYVSMISADNFGLGQIGAELLSPYIPDAGTVGILSYGVDFFVTNEREIAFRQWMENNRLDLNIKHAKFADLKTAGTLLDTFLTENPDVNGLFAVWDEPAIAAVSALRARNLELPMTAVDLGNEVAIDLAQGGLIKGIGAQQPYAQGVAIAKATIMSLIGQQPPSWVALPGLKVTPENVIETYQVVWHSPAPPELLSATK